MRYKTSIHATALAANIFTEQELVSAVLQMHPTMREEGERLLRARDQAARLMSGQEPYIEAWRDAADLSGYDPQQIDLWADQLVALCMSVPPQAAYNAEHLYGWLYRVAETDPAHPLAANWRVIHAACHPMDQPAPDWSAIAALVPEPELQAAPEAQPA